MQRILDDMGVKDPKTAVMVGDNIRADGTGAIAVGMNFAWQKQGTVIDEPTNRCYRTFCQDPNYKLTAAEHLEQMNDTNRPTAVLNGFADLNKFYRFTAKNTKQSALLTAALSKKARTNR